MAATRRGAEGGKGRGLALTAAMTAAGGRVLRGWCIVCTGRRVVHGNSNRLGQGRGLIYMHHPDVQAGQGAAAPQHAVPCAAVVVMALVGGRGHVDVGQVGQRLASPHMAMGHHAVTTRTALFALRHAHTNVSNIQ